MNRRSESQESSEAREEREENERRLVNLKRLIDSAGRRYAKCTLKNYLLHGTGAEMEAQQAIVDQVRRFGRTIVHNVDQGKNLVLFGPPGTGKDHLAIALSRKACEAGFVVKWTQGMRIFEKRRDGITLGESEKSLVSQYRQPDVLVISDPIPPYGNLNDGQSEFLFRIIDDRYRAMKPIWVTVNTGDGKELAGKIGVQVVDRLRHGALCLDCNWSSYRKPSG